MENYGATVRPAYAVADSQSALMRSVFGWMTVGLLVTAGVSSYVLSSPTAAAALLSRGRLIFLMFLELGLVFWLSFRFMKMSATTATTVFLGYSALNGITLAPLAFVYTGESISSTFLITSGVFGSMALYGYVTKRDLTGLGSFMIMGLFGLIIATLVNFFLQSTMTAYVISILGVIIFTGLTAYDVQKIKNLAGNVSQGSDDFRRVAIIGALALYLDFINLFLQLLRLVGDRRS